MSPLSTVREGVEHRGEILIKLLEHESSVEVGWCPAREVQDVLYGKCGGQVYTWPYRRRRFSLHSLEDIGKNSKCFDVYFGLRSVGEECCAYRCNCREGPSQKGTSFRLLFAQMI